MHRRCTQAPLGALDPRRLGVASSKDPDTGLVFGIARPVPLEECAAAARNFGYGTGLTAWPCSASFPSRLRMTRNLHIVTRRGPHRPRRPGHPSARALEKRVRQARPGFTHGRDRSQAAQQQLWRENGCARSRRSSSPAADRVRPEEPRPGGGPAVPASLLRGRCRAPRVRIACRCAATEWAGTIRNFVLAADGALTATIGDATGHGREPAPWSRRQSTCRRTPVFRPRSSRGLPRLKPWPCRQGPCGLSALGGPAS